MLVDILLKNARLYYITVNVQVWRRRWVEDLVQIVAIILVLLQVVHVVHHHNLAAVGWCG
jgi:hypothetical protein